MNKIHRTVWSESRKAHVVAHEGAASRGMPSSTRSVIASTVVIALASLASAPALAVACPPANAGMITVNTAISGTCYLNSGESIIVNGTAPASGQISGDIDGINLGFAVIIDGITNSGTISGSSSGSTSGILAIDSNIISSINNSGTISGGTYGIYADQSNIITSITNSGTISGGTYGIYADYGNIINSITNSGTISGANASINIGSGSILSSLTIAGNDTAKFIGMVNAPNTPVSIVSGATYTLHATDNFQVQSFTNNGTMAVAAGTTGTLPNYTQSAEGVFRTHITDNNTYGKLVVTGTATLPSNAKIDVDVATAGFAFTATSFNDIISAGTLSGGENFTVTDNSLLFNFSAVKDGDTVDLTLAAAPAPTTDPAPAPASTSAPAPAPASAPAAAPDPTFTQVEQIVRAAGNSPAYGAAKVLGQIFASAPSGPVSLRFASVTDNAGVNRAVSQSQPNPSASVGAAHTASGAMAGVVQDRIAFNQDASVKLGLASGDAFYGDKNVWMKPFGSWADQGKRSGAAGFKASTSGLAFGVDGTASDGTQLGASFAYAAASTDGTSSVAPNRTKVDVYQLIGYGSHSLDPVTHLNFQAGLGQNKNKGQRQITFAGTTASASFDSLVATLGAGVGRNVKLSDTTSFTPSVRADYSWIKDSAYTERGAGALNLNVAGRTTDELILAADGKLSHRYASGTSVTANLGLGYDALSQQRSLTSTYAGAPGLAFTTQGIDPSPWLVRGGLGIATQLQNGVELSARYDVEYREDFLNQTASVKLRWAF